MRLRYNGHIAHVQFRGKPYEYGNRDACVWEYDLNETGSDRTQA